jgi:hypothetical protein
MPAPVVVGQPARVVEAAFNTADATVTFNVGDALVQTGGFVSPIGSGTATTNFLGYAAQYKPAGVHEKGVQLMGNSTPGRVRVVVDGHIDIDDTVDETVTLNVGDFVGPDGNQKVKKVGAASISLGTVVRPKRVGETRVRIKINSAVAPAANK